MKRTSTVLVAVAMMIGALGAMGCARPAAEQAQPEAAPAVQPVEEAAPVEARAATEEKASVVASVAVRAPAPPALRVEAAGRAPSPRHVWQRGYWRWSSPRTEYVWVPGYWVDNAAYAPHAPPPARYENPGYAPGHEYVYVPGYWRWSGVEFVWYVGHWSHRNDCGHYYRPRWENVNGRYAPRVERWSHERSNAWAREREARRAATPTTRPRHEEQAPAPQHKASAPTKSAPPARREAAAPIKKPVRTMAPARVLPVVHKAAPPSAPADHKAASPSAPPARREAAAPKAKPAQPATPVVRAPAVAAKPPVLAANSPAVAAPKSPRAAKAPGNTLSRRGRS